MEQLFVLLISLALADEVIHFVKHLNLCLQDIDKHQHHCLIRHHLQYTMVYLVILILTLLQLPLKACSNFIMSTMIGRVCF